MLLQKLQQSQSLLQQKIGVTECVCDQAKSSSKINCPHSRQMLSQSLCDAQNECPSTVYQKLQAQLALS